MTKATFIDRVPHAVIAASDELPKRFAFVNATSPLFLMALDRGKAMKHFCPPAPLFLTVTFGRVWVEESEIGRTLGKFNEVLLEENTSWNIQALSCCELLLLPYGLNETKRRQSVAEFFNEHRRIRIRRTKPPLSSQSRIETLSMTLRSDDHKVERDLERILI